MSANEKLCLKWNDFQTNINSSFKDLRNGQDFTDVTLVCGDNQRIEVHKIILASASKVFKNILQENKHPHPLIYMMGIDTENLESIVDFVYYGETNILQNNLDSFFLLATELDVKGLAQNQEASHIEEAMSNPSIKPKKKPKNLNTVPREPNVFNEDIDRFLGLQKKFELSSSDIKREHIQGVNIQHTSNNTLNVEDTTNKTELLYESTVSLMNESTHLESKSTVPFNENIGLDEQINSMINNLAGVWTCSVCGKTDKHNFKNNLQKHIETHIQGLSHSCNHCGKTFRSRNARQLHISRKHNNKNILQVKEFQAET